MHASCRSWVSNTVQNRGLAKLSVLEVGSMNVNGTVREYFSGPYIGVDFREGDGVDYVMNAHNLEFDTNLFDVVISTEMLEHDDAFWLSMAEMGRVLKTGGTLIITTRGNGFAEHGHPYDYWRFMPNSGKVLMELAGCELISCENDPEPGIFVIGVKR